jgi:hypothetical protein
VILKINIPYANIIVYASLIISFAFFVLNRRLSFEKLKSNSKRVKEELEKRLQTPKNADTISSMDSHADFVRLQSILDSQSELGVEMIKDFKQETVFRVINFLILPALSSSRAWVYLGKKVFKFLKYDREYSAVLLEENDFLSQEREGISVGILDPLTGKVRAWVFVEREQNIIDNTFVLLQKINEFFGLEIVRFDRYLMPMENKEIVKQKDFLRFSVHMLPVLVLSIIFPYVQAEMAATWVGNTTLDILSLMTSVTFPWIAQLSCFPLYRSLGDDIYKSGMSILPDRLIARIPPLFMISAFISLLTGLAFGNLFHWNATDIFLYTLSTSAHVLFAQLLVYASLSKDFLFMGIGWGIYCITLFLFPDIGYIAPMLASVYLFIHIFLQRSSSDSLKLSRPSIQLLFRGFLLGSIVWGDKVLYFLKSKNFENPAIVFICLIGPIVLQATFYVKFAPTIQDLLDKTLNSIISDSVWTLPLRNSRSYLFIKRTFVELFLLGGVFVLPTVILLSFFFPDQAIMSGLCALTSWNLATISIVMILFLFIQQSSFITFFGIFYVAILVILAVLPQIDVVETYGILFGVTSISLPFLIYLCLKEWKNPEFGIFWKANSKSVTPAGK